MSAPASSLRVAAAWGVHAFTASGAVAGLLALLALDRGEPRQAALCMLAALSIDSVDGMLARAVGVAGATPRFDGRRLDDIVDYLNYAAVPAVFLVAAGVVSHWGFAALALLASAYGFAQTAAKTEDHFFLGFPSYWNVLAIYAWLLGVPPALGSALVVAFAALIFVPFKYVYPSHMPVLRRTHHALAVACALLVVAGVLAPERARALHLVELSLVYPAFYLGVSLWQGGLHRPARRG